MTIGEIPSYLQKSFTEFKSHNTDLPYVLASDFAHYLLQAARVHDVKTLRKGAQFINALLEESDESIKNLAGAGYLEGIQNVWSNNNQGTDEIYQYFSPSTKRQWLNLKNDWDKLS